MLLHGGTRMEPAGNRLQEIDTTPGRVIRIWWLIAWRSIVAFAVAIVVIGIVVNVVFGYLFGMSIEILRQFIPFIGIIVFIVWTIISVYMALNKQYSDFRVTLVALKK